MINIMISIPVHEKTEVVIDQIVNYKHFCPNCGIVLHISKSFDYENSFHTEREFHSILGMFENVFINPHHLDTSYADIVHTHVSNFDYISQLIDFEYFALGSSNDLFVRSMPDIAGYDINCSIVPLEKKHSWGWYNPTINDPYLMNIIEYLHSDKSDIQTSQIEGSFYKKDIFKEIANLINKFYNYNEVSKQNRTIYPREEVYYPTIAYLINKQFNNCRNNYTFVPWKSRKYMPSMKEISDISIGNMEGKYSIKRVLRNFNDIIRFHVGNNIGHYRNTSIDQIKIKFNKMYRTFFNMSAGRRRIFVGNKDQESHIRDIFKIKTNETYLPFMLTSNDIFKINNEDNISIKHLLIDMDKNREAIFIICIDNYPSIFNYIIEKGFRENIDFMDGSWLTYE